MTKRRDNKVHMIPIDRITVLNHRERGQDKFQSIVANIAQLGLKRPITVGYGEGTNGRTTYLLGCGEGRLEAFKALGQTEIPAVIVDATKEELLLMSLVENLARRQHATVDLAKEIITLKDRGHTFTEIARTTALDQSYVRGIYKLLKKGEERLVMAVERHKIPLSVAITIASSEDKDVQRALAEAYENNDLRGKALLTARRLVESRRTHGKGNRAGGRRANGESVNSDTLIQAYRDETTRQRLIIQRAKICETRLLFAVSAIKNLFENENIINLLRAESLDSLPEYLAEQIHPEGK